MEISKLAGKPADPCAKTSDASYQQREAGE
jgi:hypothetical protein